MPKKTKNKCIFSDAWLSDSRFSGWLKRIHNKWEAYCVYCQKSFDIYNMGVASLSSHASGKKHSDIHMQRSRNTGTTFFGNSSTGEVQQTNKKGNLVRKENKVQKKLDSVTVPTNALRAEVLWTLKVISSHYSLRSCLGLKELFEAMFCNSEIAKSFKLSKTKCDCFINFGLAPYFKDLLVKEIKAANIFVVSFDESLNKVLQEEQMDVQVRYWNEAAKQVNTRFFDSQFLKRPNVTNLFDCLTSSLKNLLLERLLQSSMDGPNTNWSVLKLLHEDRCEKDYPNITDIGSCSLHVVHGAFKSGIEAKNCDLKKIMKAMWKIFDGSPARRDICIKMFEVEEFPLSYCLCYIF